MTRLAKGMRTGPPPRVYGSPARRLAWGTVATSLLPWAIAAMVIPATGLPESVDDGAGERCLMALVASVITVIVGLIASLMAEKEDSTTPQIALVAVVLASFTILIAGAMLVKTMQ